MTTKDTTSGSDTASAPNRTQSPQITHCAECGQRVEQLSADHLRQCCGLTLQEYAIRHRTPLELIVPRDLINRFATVDNLPPACAPGGNQALILAAVKTAGALRLDDNMHTIVGEVRRLEQLLWMGHLLNPCGFRFFQEYAFNDETHRLVALNRLKARYAPEFELIPKIDGLALPEFLFYATVVAILCAEQVGEYIFLRCADAAIATALRERFHRDFSVAFKPLQAPTKPPTGDAWLRTATISDTDSLLNILRRHLDTIPCASEQFYVSLHEQPRALVAKELVFDAAHFITDHPGACANMHGGRYKLIVKIEDRINPHTGFVIDYGLLKRLMQHCVVDRLDHKNLNLSAHDLAWRSSTELLAVFIWENLIEYLPNLYELQIYETEQSFCSYRGPTLKEYRHEGVYSTGSYFRAPNLGHSLLRRRLGISQLSFRMRVIDSLEREKS